MRTQARVLKYLKRTVYRNNDFTSVLPLHFRSKSVEICHARLTWGYCVSGSGLHGLLATIYLENRDIYQDISYS